MSLSPLYGYQAASIFLAIVKTPLAYKDLYGLNLPFHPGRKDNQRIVEIQARSPTTDLSCDDEDIKATVGESNMNRPEFNAIHLIVYFAILIHA